MKNYLTTLAVLSLSFIAPNAMAYSLIVKNDTNQPVIPFVDSIDKHLSADSVNGWLYPDKERIYDLRSTWLTAPAMGVKSGDTRNVEIGGASCGEVKFEGVKSIQLSQDNEGLKCTVLQVPQITESSAYSYPVAIIKVGYVISEFNNSDDNDIPNSYVEGPTKIITARINGFTKVKFNAVNSVTKEEHPVFVKMQRYIGYGRYTEVESTAPMYELEQSDFYATYVPEWNTDLPKGKYTGIAKIKAQQHWGTGDGQSFNFGVIINNEK